MTHLPVDVPSVVARLARIEERLDALEAAAAGHAEETRPDPADLNELHRLAWAVKHGRQRPW